MSRFFIFIITLFIGVSQSAYSLLHEVQLTLPTAGRFILEKGNNHLELGFVYSRYMQGGLQIGLGFDLDYLSQAGASLTTYEVTVRPTYNFMTGRGRRRTLKKAVFVQGVFGVRKILGQTRLVYGFILGKRFPILSRLSYNPSIEYKKTEGIKNARFIINFFGISYRF